MTTNKKKKKSQGVTLFIKAFEGKLLSDIDKDGYKSIKNQFFVIKHKKKYGLPSDNEICHAIVSDILIKKKLVSNAKELQNYIDSICVLSANNINSREYEELIKLTLDKSKYSPQYERGSNANIEKIKENLEEKYKEKFKAKAVEENEILLKENERIGKDIEDKKKEYQSLPSLLDDKEFISKQKLNLNNTTKTNWWDDLYLKEDPFKYQDGLDKVDEELYDSIIVKTKGIEIVESNNYSSEFNLFGTAIPLYGDFGSGKSCLVDYWAYKLLATNDIPTLQCRFRNSVTKVEGLIRAFERTFCKEIIKLRKSSKLSYEKELLDFEESTYAALDYLESTNSKGFLIFIDELHKFQNFELILAFLGNLQSIKNSFSRDGINVAFVVSLLPRWQSNIKNDSRLYGFFNNNFEIYLDKVSPYEASECILKRLDAFSLDESPAHGISNEFLSELFKENSEKSLNIDYRRYFETVNIAFDKKIFDIDSLKDINLSDSILEKIKKGIESNGYFIKCIKDLLDNKDLDGDYTLTKNTLSVFLKIFCSDNGILESHNLFIKEAFYFKCLENSGLIQRVKSKDILCWRAPRELHELDEEIHDMYGVGMDRYLIRLYAGLKKQDVNIFSNKRFYNHDESLKILKQYIDNDLYVKLQKIVVNYEDSYNRIQSRLDRNYKLSYQNIKPLIYSIEKLMFFICDYEGASNPNNSNDILDLWSNRYYSSEAPINVLQTAKQYRETGAEEHNEIIRIYKTCDQTFNEIFKELTLSAEIYNILKRKPNNIPKKLNVLIRSHAESLFKVYASDDDTFEGLRLFTAQLEYELRNYLHLGSLLFLGEAQERIKQLPRELSEYANHGNWDYKSMEHYNEFEEFNRGQYRSVFTGIKDKYPIKKYLINPITKNWTKSDLDYFFKIFGDINIDVSHNKHSKIIKRKGQLENFCKFSCSLIADLYGYLLNIILCENSVEEDKDSYLVTFGQSHDCHIVEKQFVEKVYDSLFGLDNDETCIPLSLFDLDEVRLHTNGSYVDSCSALAVLTKEKLPTKRIKFISNFSDTLSLSVQQS